LTPRLPSAARRARRIAGDGRLRGALALAVAGLATCGIGTRHAAAQARPEPLPCPGNLLDNPGMEEGFGVRGALDQLVPHGWSPWHAEPEGAGAVAPRFGARRSASALGPEAADGLWSAELATRDATHLGGLWQRVAVEPGLILQASAFALGWASNGPPGAPSDPPGTYAVAIGLDPAGGEDPGAATIRWTAALTVTDAWLPLTVSVEAQRPAVTLFLRGQPLAPLAGAASRWDAACLRATGRAGEPAFPVPRLPLPTPTRGPGTPEPTEDPLQAAAVAARLREGLAAAAATSGSRGAAAPPAPATLAAVATRLSGAPVPAIAEPPPPPPLSAVLAERVGWLSLSLAAFVAGLLLGMGRGGAP